MSNSSFPIWDSRVVYTKATFRALCHHILRDFLFSLNPYCAGLSFSQPLYTWHPSGSWPDELVLFYLDEKGLCDWTFWDRQLALGLSLLSYWLKKGHLVLLKCFIGCGERGEQSGGRGCPNLMCGPFSGPVQGELVILRLLAWFPQGKFQNLLGMGAVRRGKKIRMAHSSWKQWFKIALSCDLA